MPFRKLRLSPRRFDRITAVFGLPLQEWTSIAFPTRAEGAVAQIVSRCGFCREPFLCNPIQRDGNKAPMRQVAGLAQSRRTRVSPVVAELVERHSPPERKHLSNH